jgi:hypothetical protein
MNASKGIWRLRWTASVGLMVVGCFWTFNAFMFPKDQWFWREGHWILFVVSPIGALILGFLLYPKGNPLLDSDAESDLTDLKIRR